jgi:hypothetical protein
MCIPGMKGIRIPKTAVSTKMESHTNGMQNVDNPSIYPNFFPISARRPHSEGLFTSLTVVI